MKVKGNPTAGRKMFHVKHFGKKHPFLFHVKQEKRDIHDKRS